MPTFIKNTNMHTEYYKKSTEIRTSKKQTDLHVYDSSQTTDIELTTYKVNYIPS